MRFPGKRKNKHYFPVEDRPSRQNLELDFAGEGAEYVVGMDQLLVDIEINVSDEFLEHYNFEKGQSFIIDDELADEIYNNFKRQGKVSGEYPGGAIGNTLHNFAVLSDAQAITLGTINKNITVGDYAYQYLCKTHSNVNLSYLQPCDRPMGRALCLVSPDGERTFAISKGCMDELDPEKLPTQIISNSVALLVSAYCLRNPNSNIAKATEKACDMALENDVPVIFSLGTSSLVREKRDELNAFIEKYVSVLAMNQEEAKELIGEDDPLICCQSLLDKCDMVLVTVGKKGLYLGAHVDESLARMTKEPLHTKSIVEYNKYEYSRAMRKVDCEKPIKIYTHINPFMGGPLIIKNTNGAGDAALSAVLHDLAANSFHRAKVPRSPKHQDRYLTYSSLSQISKYANRVSFEVLVQSSPRLIKGLPQKEDSLEEAYWDK